MPKNYTLKAETGYLTSKLQGEQPDQNIQTERRIDVNDMIAAIVGMHNLLVKMTNVLQASNEFLIRIKFHADSKGHIDQTVDMDFLDGVIGANEAVLGVARPKNDPTVVE